MGIIPLIIKELKCYSISNITTMLRLLSSKPASPHFCNCEKHFTLPFSITWLGRSEMRWCEIRCVDRKADEPESLYTFSLCVITFLDKKKGHSSGQAIHQVPECIFPSQRVLLPGPTASSLIWHSHIIHWFRWLWKHSFEKITIHPFETTTLPLLSGHFYGQALATHLSYAAGTPAPN